MVTYALLAFALAAVGGLVLASRAPRAKLAPGRCLSADWSIITASAAAECG